MRVLQLVTRRQHRGAEVFASALADALVDRGDEAHLLGIYPPPEPPVRPRRAGWSDLGPSSRLKVDPRTVWRLAAAIRELEPDIVQANGSDTLKYSVLARSVSGGDWSLVYRNISIMSRWIRGPVHRAWNRWLVQRVDGVVAVSRASADDFAATFGADAAHLTVIPQSVHVPAELDRERARARLAEAADVPLDAAILMHVGSFTPEKNHLWLLDRFAELVGALEPAPYLVLAGGGPLAEAVRGRAGAPDLAGRVRLLGVRPDVESLLAGADLLLLPSRIEGLPGVVLEAAAHGVPALATDVGGVAEAVHDGTTGVLVESGDGSAFVREAAALIRDPERRRDMGRRARELMIREFSHAQAVDRYQSVYRALVSQPGASRGDGPT